MCGYYIRKIEGLDIKDHLDLALLATSERRSVFFSLMALVISLILLAFKIFKTFSEQVDQFFQRMFS